MACYNRKEFAFGQVIIRDIMEREVTSIAAAFGCHCINSICRPMNQGCYASILNGNYCYHYEENSKTGLCQAEFYILPTYSDIDAGSVHQAIECAIKDSVFRKAKLQYDLSWKIDGIYLDWESHVVNIEHFIPPKGYCPQITNDDLHPYPDYKNVYHAVLSKENMMGGTAEEKRKEMDKEEVNAESLKAIAESLKTIIELVKKL